jgi:hypothetical protein
MSLMCIMESCKAKKGMCAHDKAMLVIALIAVLAFVGWKFI